MIVYAAINLINEKKYIGQTTFSLEHRIKGHLNYAMKNGKGHFQNAIRKYGIENFSWKILSQCESKEEMDEMEFHFIIQFNTHNREFGYNMTYGGDGTLGFSKDNKGENNPFFRKKHTEESKKKMSEIKKGKKITEEHKKAISISLKEAYKNGTRIPVFSDYQRKVNVERMKNNNPMRNKETREKLSRTISGAGNPCAIKVKFTNDCGEEFIVEGAMGKFCKEHNLSYKIMRGILYKTRKDMIHNGWTVERIDKIINKKEEK